MEYKKYNKDDIEKIIANHQHYLNQDCENWGYMKADLSFVDLSNMNLEGANLRYAVLYKANLVRTNLEDANLRGAILKYADLTAANLEDVNLRDADLEGANLRYANLRYAILSSANLLEANLEDANLKCANLYDTDLINVNLCNADLYNANLFGADLTGANLRYADLEGVNLSATISDQSKMKGEILTQDIIGYKKCQNNIIVTLKIPRGAIVFSINGNKCRTNKAIVLDIEDFKGNKVDRAISTYKYMSYYVGDEITDYTFDCQYNIECSNGIHFFKSKEEAKIFQCISKLISDLIDERQREA